MAASIRSLRNGITPVIGASRNDLVAGDVVALNSVDAATTYAWNIAFKPNGSAAAFSGSPVAQSPGTFTVDLEGPYLIRLIVDLGLPTEDTQFVRLRALTVYGSLRLVAAGEQYLGALPVPVDANLYGWANDQNFNLQAILNLILGLTPVPAVYQEEHAAAAFAFGGATSTVALAHTPVVTATTEGIILLYRNGVVDMTRTAGAPALVTEYRVTTGPDTLEIGGDVTASGNTYRIVYPG